MNSSELIKQLREVLPTMIATDLVSMPTNQAEQKLVDMIRRIDVPNMMAMELVDTQPILPSVFSDLIARSSSKEQLVNEGYKPVSQTGLLWWFKDNEEETK